MFAQFSQKYRYSLILLRQLVITDLKLRYQGSWLGYLWSLLRPLAFFVILYIIFGKFVKTLPGIDHPALYLLLGVVVWNYFAEVTNLSVASIVGRGDLIRKINFPKYVIVLAGSFSALINLAISFVIVFVFMAATGVVPNIDALWFVPLLVIELFIFAIAVAFFLSAVYVRLRDVGYIWELFMQAAFYATPILYSLSFVTNATVQQGMMLNPIAQIIQDLRAVLITSKAPTIGSVFANEWVRLVPIIIVCAITLLAVWYFRRRSKHFAEDV
ncbi:MAG TPA: ABC transporter permease [Candidatus Saccharimonas sp.]|nr:ABC transporter permease [Candidatus Saccharimonas sp.]